jgi:hypothetical protein
LRKVRAVERSATMKQPARHFAAGGRVSCTGNAEFDLSHVTSAPQSRRFSRYS